MEPRFTKHLIYIGMFIIALAFGVLLMWPFLIVIILSAALAVVFTPVQRWYLKKITRGNAWLAALLSILTFLIAICGPLALIGISVFHQAQGIYLSLAEQTSTSELISRVNGTINHYFPWSNFRIEDRALGIAGAVTSRLGDIVSFVFETLFSLFLVILAMFYFLKDGARWRSSIIKNSPLSDDSTNRVMQKLSHAVNGVIKGYLLIGVLQGVLLGLGLWLFGIPNPALWGVFAGIASLIPTIGTALVSVPAVIFLFSVGNTAAAIGLAVWSGFLVGLIDNLLSPVIVGRKIDIHPMFILFSVLGGIALMGPAGILIGPLVVSFIYALTSVYSSEMKQ
jgi:predicted PurR-regulated permease PerM